MRQAGVIAAAGIVALGSMVERLAEDHRRASRLAEGLNSIPGIELTKGSPNTNMVFFRLGSELPVSVTELIGRMQESNIFLMDTVEGDIRLVTHNDIDDQAVETFLSTLKTVLSD